MKLPIGEVIYSLRKEKGVTQEQLAQAVGVSVPAVSKWESKNAYPDITLLPAIARYFNTTIDKLLKYEITISNEDVMEIITKCATVFENESLESSVKFCNDYINQYPNNSYLKFRVGSLYMMYLSKAESEDGIIELAHKAIDLLEQSALSKDTEISEGSNYILSSLYSVIGEDKKAEEVLLLVPKKDINRDDMLIPLYIKQERYEEAKKILQRNMLSNINKAIMLLTSFSSICAIENDMDYAKDILFIQRDLIKLFKIEEISLLSNSSLISRMYAKEKNVDKTLDYIEELIDSMNKFIEYKEKGLDNRMFDTIEFSGTIQSNDYILKTIRRSIELDHEYDFLRDNSRYKALMEKLDS